MQKKVKLSKPWLAHPELIQTLTVKFDILINLQKRLTIFVDNDRPQQ